MNKLEYSLITSLLKNEIAKDDFVKKFPELITSKYAQQELLKAYNAKSDDDLWPIIILIFNFNLLDNEMLPLLEKILPNDWHTSHEDIVDLLGMLASPTSVQLLTKVCATQYEYLKYDDSFNLSRKCIKALSYIDTKDSIESIRLLSHDNNLIGKYACEELNKPRLSN